MARLARLVIPGQPHHLIQWGHNRQPVFQDDEDRRAYLAALKESAVLSGVAIHAYVLLPNQVQLLCTPAEATSLGRMMQALGRRYVGRYNRRHQRSGALWEGRFRATVIQPDRYLVPCTVFIESLPLQHEWPQRPQDYRWSSAAHHCGSRPDALLTAHAVFWGLGNTPFEREARYRTLLEAGLVAAEAQRIGDAAAKGWALGDEAFLASLAGTTVRRVTPGQRGRPRKEKTVPI